MPRFTKRRPNASDCSTVILLDTARKKDRRRIGYASSKVALSCLFVDGVAASSRLHSPV